MTDTPTPTPTEPEPRAALVDALKDADILAAALEDVLELANDNLVQLRELLGRADRARRQLGIEIPGPGGPDAR